MAKIKQAQVFTNETDFEDAVVQSLLQNGWTQVLTYKTQEELIQNWADILFNNNQDSSRLGQYRLTKTEIQSLINNVSNVKNPYKINEIINGKEIILRRDNPDDKAHFGKDVALRIYDRNEIAGGKSTYQIARQPIFDKKDEMGKNRRGDLTLLINGMPLIHIELKASGVPISQAYGQIEKYSNENLFTDFYSMVQVFLAMTPDETLYFANPGTGGKFNPSFFFHWADFNNNFDQYDNWYEICQSLLHIPLAHELIGFYTIADEAEQTLKVMRSYQIHAAKAVTDRVSKICLAGFNTQLGGYVWHTTGSGKTMTSFKTAQLIINRNEVDKVIFLMDRIELGTQSLEQYKGFAPKDLDVQGTENSSVLLKKLKSNKDFDRIIVTSIQKMSRIKEEENGKNKKEIELIAKKKIVFIIDEAHRSTFGEMLLDIKNTFESAIFFGFTGTPIFDVNAKIGATNGNKSTIITTSSIFGDELSRYSIANGIKDGNVLGFDTFKVCTFSDQDIRQAVALDKAKAVDMADINQNPEKAAIFNEWMFNDKLHPMAFYIDSTGKKINGIEDELPNNQYDGNQKHHKSVVKDILDGWQIYSRTNKFHAILATSSINEAMDYYELFKSELKERNMKLNITALFDPNEGNAPVKATQKSNYIKTILTDYNNMYFGGTTRYTHENHSEFKADLCQRLAHKSPYNVVTQDTQLDLLIVVEQMLTGYDSKFINTLYLDKELEYENIIQAFSRTNRLYNAQEKPFGMIKYYRRPHTMEKKIRMAIETYSGNRPFDLFVDKLQKNIESINDCFKEIEDTFKKANPVNPKSGNTDIFSSLPKTNAEIHIFVKAFNTLNKHLAAAKSQGYSWKENCYNFDSEGQKINTNSVNKTTVAKTITMPFDEITFNKLVQRYKDISNLKPAPQPGSQKGSAASLPFDLNSAINAIKTDKIDANYMNSNFTLYMKDLTMGVNSNIIALSLSKLHSSFATLSPDQQQYAIMILDDINTGNLKVDPNKNFTDYLTLYTSAGVNKIIGNFVQTLGLDSVLFHTIIDYPPVTTANINQNNRFDNLIKSANQNSYKQYIEQKNGKTYSGFALTIELRSIVEHAIITSNYTL